MVYGVVTWTGRFRVLSWNSRLDLGATRGGYDIVVYDGYRYLLFSRLSGGYVFADLWENIIIIRLWLLFVYSNKISYGKGVIDRGNSMGKGRRRENGLF